MTRLSALWQYHLRITICQWLAPSILLRGVVPDPDRTSSLDELVHSIRGRLDGRIKRRVDPKSIPPIPLLHPPEKIFRLAGHEDVEVWVTVLVAERYPNQSPNLRETLKDELAVLLGKA